MSKAAERWDTKQVLFLFLLISPFFLSYYGYDSIGASLPDLALDLNIDSAGVGFLYASYSVPVIAAVVFIGGVMDRHGVRNVAICMSMLSMLGSYLVAYGNSITWMLIGRVVFGLGAECQLVASQKLMTTKYREIGVSFVIGASVFWGQLGTACAFFFIPSFLRDYTSKSGLTSVVMLAILNFISTVIYCWLDVREDREDHFEVRADGYRQLRKTTKVMEDVSREFGYSEMTLPFKLITVMYFSITASFFVWNGVSSSVLVQLHGWSLPVATVLVSFTNFIVGTSPLFGHFVDRYGGRTLFFTFGSFLLALSFFAIGHYQDQSPALWYITMGLSVAIMQANVLSAVPLIISERVSAQGYAVLSLVNNFGMLVLPPLVGYLRSTTGSFNAPIQLFTFIASLSFVCSLVFIVLDRKSGGSVFQTQSSSKRGSVDPSRDIFM